MIIVPITHDSNTANLVARDQSTALQKSSEVSDYSSCISQVALSILSSEMYPVFQGVIVPYMSDNYFEIYIAELGSLVIASNDSIISKSINKIRTLVVGNHFIFTMPADHHMLHDQVTAITLRVRSEENLKIIWGIFLNSIDKRKAQIIGNQDVVLDFTTEIAYLNNPNKNPGRIQVEQWVLSSKAEDQVKNKEDLAEMAAISLEAFGEHDAYPLDYITELVQDPNGVVIVARDELTKKIEGYIIAKQEIAEDADLQEVIQWHIMHVVRRANTSKRGIANALFMKCLDILKPKKQTIYLEVRESNTAAQELYKKFGFEEYESTPNFYSHPTETGIVMGMDPA